MKNRETLNEIKIKEKMMETKANCNDYCITKKMLNCGNSYNDNNNNNTSSC